MDDSSFGEELGAGQRVEPLPAKVSMLTSLWLQAKGGPRRFDDEDNPRREGDYPDADEDADNLGPGCSHLLNTTVRHKHESQGNRGGQGLREQDRRLCCNSTEDARDHDAAEEEKLQLAPTRP